MKNWAFEDWVIVTAIPLMAIIILWAFVYAAAQTRAEKECLARGWAHGDVDWTLNAYCITRVDQTDVVRPLEKAEQR